MIQFKYHQSHRSDVFFELFWVLIFCGILILPSLSLAGNKWMMEKMEQNLIKLNEEVIRKIVNVENNSQIHFKARIVQQEKADQHLILIDEVNILPMNESLDFSEEPFSMPGDYITYQPLNIPGIKNADEVLLKKDSTLVLAEYLENVRKMYPDALIIQIHDDIAKGIDWKNEDLNRFEPSVKPKKLFLILRK